MRRNGRLDIHTHVAFELLLGAALIVLPFALALSAAAIILGVALGGLLISVALSGAEPDGRGGLPLSTHAAYDTALATAFALSGVALGASQGARPLILFLAAALAELTVSASTRYSARVPPRRVLSRRSTT